MNDKPKDGLQEIADRYGVFIYVADRDRKGCQKITTCGTAAHGVDCERSQQAADAVIDHLNGCR